jgi:LysM repeat protein
MNRGWISQVFLVLAIILSAWAGSPLRASAAAASQAYDLIDQVNSLRSANGLPSYQVDNALMAAAQAQSDWQASTGSVTHTGAGGSRPRDRAAAAGFGGGAQIFVSENIAGGGGLTAAEAVSWWQGDAPHLNTMLSPNYVYIGAGAASSGGTVYLTILAGYWVGSAGSAANPTAQAGTAVSPGGGAPAYSPPQTATPAADGSVIHVVQAGQTLWTIAAIYGVSLADLYAINQMNENTFIYPGDKVTIRPASTPTATATLTPAPSTPRPTATPSPTRVLRPTATINPGADAGDLQAERQGGNQSQASIPQAAAPMLNLDPRRSLAAVAIALAAIVAVLALSRMKE